MKALHLGILITLGVLRAQAQVLSIDTFDDGTLASGQSQAQINAGLVDAIYNGSSMINGVRVLATYNAVHSLSVGSGAFTVSGNTAPARELSYYPNLNLDASGHTIFSVQISSATGSSDIGISLSDGSTSATGTITGITAPGQYQVTLSQAPGFDLSHITRIALVAPIESFTRLSIGSFGLATVPEPSTYALMTGLMLSGFVIWRSSRHVMVGT